MALPVIKIGTSGYSYEDWRGVFYPSELPRGEMLAYYAQFFDAVEINATYYRIPHRAVFYHMGQKTPEGFDFIVKVHQEVTHVRQKPEEAMNALLEAIQPIEEMGKFSGFLAQFPYAFKNTSENRAYLVYLKEWCGQYPLFVEFRNWTWNHPAVAEFLQQQAIGYVNVDQPRLRGLLPPQEIVTTDVGYVRFHGRNKKEWWQGTNETRYDYLYTREELTEWVGRIGNILKKSTRGYLFFNNHPQGKAVQNARLMKAILEEHLTFLKNSSPTP